MEFQHYFSTYILSNVCLFANIFFYRFKSHANGSNTNRAATDSDASPSKVKMLIGAADDMLKQKNVESILFNGKRIGEESNFEKLDWFAEQLVLEHQRRSCRIAPTVAFKQATPKPS